MKKLISITLVLVMLLSALSVGAVAPTRTPKAMVNFLSEAFAKGATANFAFNAAESGAAAHDTYNFAYLKRKSAAYTTADIISAADEFVLTFDAKAEKAAGPFLVSFKAPSDSYVTTGPNNKTHFSLKFSPAVFVDGEALKTDKSGTTVAAVSSWGGDGKLASDWYTFKITVDMDAIRNAKNDNQGNVYDLNIAPCVTIEKKAKGAADSTYAEVTEVMGGGPIAYESVVRTVVNDGGFSNTYNGTDYTLGFGVLNGGQGADYVLYNNNGSFGAQGDTAYCVDNVSIDYMGTQSAKYAKTSGIQADMDFEDGTYVKANDLLYGTTSVQTAADGDKYLKVTPYGGGKHIIAGTAVPGLKWNDFSASVDIYKKSSVNGRPIHFIAYETFEQPVAGTWNQANYGFIVPDSELPAGVWYTFRMDSNGNIMKKVRDDASAQWTTVTLADGTFGKNKGNVSGVKAGEQDKNEEFWIHTNPGSNNVNCDDADEYYFDNIRVGKLTTASVETSSKTASSASAKVHVVDANKTAAASATIATILAVYNGDVLVDVMYVDAPATKGYATAELELEAAGNKAKIYVWDTFASGTPRLADPIEL